MTLIENRGRPSWDFLTPFPRPSSALPPPEPPPSDPRRNGPYPNLKTPNLGPQEAHDSQNRIHWLRIQRAIAGCFAQNGPEDRENPLLQRFWPISGLKTKKYFQCAPLEGGTEGRKREFVLSRNEKKLLFRFFRV